MKSLRITAHLFFLAFFLISNSHFAVSEETEQRLMEKALIESAVTSEQKTAVANYLRTMAAQKASRAEELRELSKRSTGGKFLANKAQSDRYRKQAEALEREVERYQFLLNNL
ncbi:hypothetical protein LFX25_14225 [Leptospira sp. FAT2]|uniref:LIC10421/LIC12816 family protein n=1 Tax=Leptospira sanjuanensis TaxID=2879643 RepID=UPI001EE7B2BE|nr:hypothetical protein [Leptospira sanjuanensis]MCG6194401.1 hypothetical protein [Leptospira sanjuanensis]